ISGEALSRNQCSPSLLTATDSCMRAVAATVPSRRPRQLPQPQFHWGKPPPAAEPRTRNRTRGAQLLGVVASLGSGGLVAAAVVTLVAADLGAHVDLFESGSFP